MDDAHDVGGKTGSFPDGLSVHEIIMTDRTSQTLKPRLIKGCRARCILSLKAQAFDMP